MCLGDCVGLPLGLVLGIFVSDGLSVGEREGLALGAIVQEQPVQSQSIPSPINIAQEYTLSFNAIHSSHVFVAPPTMAQVAGQLSVVLWYCAATSSGDNPLS